MVGVSHRLEVGLMAGLVALATAAVCLVELTPHGKDRYVWVGALVVIVGGALAWRAKRWPARPWVVLALAAAVFVVGYTVVMMGYLTTQGNRAG